MLENSVEALAARLNAAWEGRQPLPPLSESVDLSRVEDAYAIQTAWGKLRGEKGERVIGRKIGLTSRAMREQLGVNEPDYGLIWESRYFPVSGYRVEFPREIFIAPRLEGEIAFLLGQPLQGPGVTLQEVLAATEAVTGAIEVVDSRIADWRIKLVDTIADNASYGALSHLPWTRQPLAGDLSLIGMRIRQNGETVVEGLGSAALGHPARAVGWLVNKLADYGVGLKAGDIVLSGALGRALPAEAGDQFTLEFAGMPPLQARFV